VREGELIVPFILGLNGAQRERGVPLEWSTTLGAEARVISVAMSTAGTEQRQVLVTVGL